MSAWDILILTMPGRERFLARLQAVLKPQVEQYPDVKVHVRMCDSQLDLGTNRQALIDSSSGEWISQIDDDDLVSAAYVSTIYPLLNRDYVGFKLQMFVDDVKQKPTFHSLRYKEWNGDANGWYRDISHVNPIRRALAIKVPMSGGFGEDERWATALRNLKIVKTEHFVDDFLYFYYWRSNKEVPYFAGQTASPPYVPPVVRAVCPECGSTATGMGGGMRICNQCGCRWG